MCNEDQDGAQREGTQDICVKIYIEGKKGRPGQAGTPHGYGGTS